MLDSWIYETSRNTVCNYFVVCSGSSNTHVNAIVSAIQKTVSKELKEKPFHTEGSDNAEWVLIDYVKHSCSRFSKSTLENIIILKNFGVMPKLQKSHRNY